MNYDHLFPLLALFVVAAGFGVANILLSQLLGPRRPNKIKNDSYECGIDPVGTARLRFSVKFYIIAMLFILFDIEAIFLYPWAVMFQQLELFGLIEMFTFLGFLIMGYVYLWRRGALDWD
jgi:NADH-quinone oxidoreductase subunit A